MTMTTKKALNVGIVVVLVLIAAYAGSQYWSKQAPKNVYNATETKVTDSALSGTTTTGNTMSGAAATGEAATYNVVENSTISWKATKPAGAHTGTVNVKDGFLATKGENVVGGEFTLDMTSIKLLDIKNDKFEGEIRDDFFEAPKYQTAKFVITSVQMTEARAIVKGDLTIKDQTHPIEFPVAFVFGGDKIMGVAELAIDRTMWGLNMWEGMVNNFLEFSINLTWNKAL